MNACQFSPEAEDDLLDIITYIAADNPAAARKLVSDIRIACSKLAEMPTLGHRREDLTSDPEVLFLCVRSHYLVIYRKNTSPLQIARVLHGSRDVAKELAQP
jgi:toxin ParE1/3/4